MDVKMIGQFLAQLRKDKGLTQEQLGEKLGVTNKTVSRWENGNYLPPVEILQLLSDLYGLTINEILSAQRLTPAQYQEKAEENIKTALRTSAFTLKEKIDFYKKKWLRDNLFWLVLELIVFIAGSVVFLWFFESWLVNILTWAVFVRLIQRRNEMMKYVEDRAYDGTGNDDRRE
jgi:transcriptional regulator with XRE-family HTH domain